MAAPDMAPAPPDTVIAPPDTVIAPPDTAIAAIEALLAGHPAIAEAAVAVVPGPGGAGQLVGFVRLDRRVALGGDLGGLDRLCADAGIGRAWRPAEYVIVDAVPRAEGGGVDRRRLLDLAGRTDLAAL